MHRSSDCSTLGVKVTERLDCVKGAVVLSILRECAGPLSTILSQLRNLYLPHVPPHLVCFLYISHHLLTDTSDTGRTDFICLQQLRHQLYCAGGVGIGDEQNSSWVSPARQASWRCSCSIGCLFIEDCFRADPLCERRSPEIKTTAELR